MTGIDLASVIASKSSSAPPYLIEIPIESSIHDFIELAKKFHILSVITFGPLGKWVGAGETQITTKDGRHYIGIVSLLDILIYFCQHPNTQLPKTRILQTIGETSEGQSLWVLPACSSIKAAMEILGKGVHRLLVSMDNAHMNDLGVFSSQQYQLCTQMDVLKMCLLHASDASVFDVSLDSILAQELMHSQVETCQLTDSMTVVLKKMAMHQISAIPIVNSNNGIVTTLSTSDLKHFFSMDSNDMIATVKHVHQMDVKTFLPHIQRHHPSTDIGIAKPQDSLLSIMKTLVQHKLHRVWITRTTEIQEEIPIAVISMTDVIRCLHGHILSV